MSQLVWALVAWSKPATLVLAAGVAANAGSAALWLVSRTAGPPFGPYAGQPEGVEAAGISVLLLQCYVGMGAGWAWSRRYRTDEISGFGRALIFLGANTVMAGAVAVGLSSSLQGHQHHHHGEVAEAEGEHPAVHEAHEEGHQHDADHADSVAPPNPTSPGPATAPVPAESGLPVIDMGLDTADDPHEGHPIPPDVVAPQPPSAAVPDELGLAVIGGETDGHHHDHG